MTWAGPVALVGTCYCDGDGWDHQPTEHGRRRPCPTRPSDHPTRTCAGFGTESVAVRPPSACADFLFHRAAAASPNSPLTRQRQGRGQRGRAVGRVVPALASAAVMPCPDTAAGGFPTTLGTRRQQPTRKKTRGRGQRLQSADQSNQTGSYKEVPPLWLPLSHLSRLALTLASPELSRSEPNCPRASDPIPLRGLVNDAEV